MRLNQIRESSRQTISKTKSMMRPSYYEGGKQRFPFKRRQESNKLTKFRRHASWVSFGSKSLGPINNQPQWPTLSPNWGYPNWWLCQPPSRPPCRPPCQPPWPPCRPTRCRLDVLWGLRDADRYLEIRKYHGRTDGGRTVGARDNTMKIKYLLKMMLLLLWM